MKKIYNVFLTLAAVFAFAACSEEESIYVAPEKTIEIVATDVEFTPDGGEGLISFNATGSVVATSNKDWCNVAVSGNSAIVTVTEWVALETRYALVTLKCDGYSVDVTVSQSGFKSLSFPYTGFRIRKEGGEKSFPYEYDRLIEATATEDWLSVSTTENTLDVTVSENTVVGPRFANVEWTVGASTGTLDVWQYGNFEAQTTWSGSYDGEYNYSGTYYSIITVDSPSYYDFFVVPAEEYETAEELEAYIIDYVEETLAWGEENGYGPGDLYYDESDSWLYPSINTPGQYKLVVFGVNDEYVPTGEYQTFDVKIIAPPSYEDFLGKWKLKSSNDAEETWEITEDVYGTSYFISGISGMTTYSGLTLKIPATYSNGILNIAATRDLGTYTNTSNYEVSFAILGVYLDDAGKKYRVTPAAGKTYALATATLNEDKDVFTITPAAYSSSPTGSFMGMQWYGLYTKTDGSTGAYSYNSSRYTPLPQEAELIEKGSSSGGGGGGGGGGDTTSGYDKWLGSWNVTRGENTDTWVITQNVKDESYYIAGFEGHPASFWSNGQQPVAKFDASTGNLSVEYQTLDSYTTKDADQNDITVTPTLVGRIVYTDGKTYYVTGAKTLFTGALATDGKSAELTPDKANIGGTEFTYVDVLWFGFVDGSAEYWYCGGVTQTLPATLTSVTSSAPWAAPANGFSMTKNLESSVSATRAYSLPAFADYSISYDKEEAPAEVKLNFARVR